METVNSDMEIKREPDEMIEIKTEVQDAFETKIELKETAKVKTEPEENGDGSLPFVCVGILSTENQTGDFLDGFPKNDDGQRTGGSWNETDDVNKSETGSDGKRIDCPYCEYKCDYRSQYVRHFRIHTGVKPFKCIFCDYRCTQKCSLVSHARKHTGEKPFVCPECDYTARHKSVLKKHMRKHV